MKRDRDNRVNGSMAHLKLAWQKNMYIFFFLLFMIIRIINFISFQFPPCALFQFQNLISYVTSSKPKGKFWRQLIRSIKMLLPWKSARNFVCLLHIDASALIWEIQLINQYVELLTWTRLHCLTLNNPTSKSQDRSLTSFSRVTMVSFWYNFIFYYTQRVI